MSGNAEQGDTKEFTNADGKKIFCRYWRPKDTPRALVFIAHGAGEHCAYYSVIAEPLAQLGLLVFAHDHVGHGESGGDKVHINSRKEYTRDIFQHIDSVTAEYKDLPIFIIGHSMGGLISLLAGLEKPTLFRGMVLIGPLVVADPHTATPVKKMMAKVVASIAPQFPVGALDSKMISRDQKIVDKYEKDPLVWHGKLKARWAVQLMAGLNELSSSMDQITWPLFVMQGSEDKLVSPTGAKLLEEKAASSDKTVQMIEGAYHQIHNEPDGVGTKAIQDICKWIEERCS